MSRSFGVVLLALTAVMAFLLGITTGNVHTPAPAASAATDIEPQPEPQIATAINPIDTGLGRKPRSQCRNRTDQSKG